MKRLFKRVLVLTMVMAAAGLWANGGQDEAATSDIDLTLAADEYSGKLVVWSFTDEVGGMVEAFNEVYPNVEVEYVTIPNADQAYLNKINQTLRAGVGAPDVFTGELAYVRQFIEAGYWENLSASPFNGETVADNIIEYAGDLGRDADGNLRGLTWQATPGALFYRRDLAREYFGTDDPAAISEMTQDMDSYLDMGRTLRDATSGEVALLAGAGDMGEPVRMRRELPWIVDGKLNLEQSMIDYMDQAKTMWDENLTAKVGTWSPAWFSGMADGSIFSYFLPTWGLHYVLKPNAEPEANNGEAEWAGNWGVATPPMDYFWGGTWLGMYQGSERKDLAWLFIEFVTSNEEFLEDWAKSTGDFVGYQPVIERIKDDFSEGFLGGQNHYDYFYERSQDIDVSNVGPYDLQINDAYFDQLDLYVNGEKTKEEAIEDFRKTVQSILPSVDVGL